MVAITLKRPDGREWTEADVKALKSAGTTWVEYVGKPGSALAAELGERAILGLLKGNKRWNNPTEYDEKQYEINE